MCIVCDKLQVSRQARVAELMAELASLVAAEDEFHADMVRQDLEASASLARYVHNADFGPVQEVTHSSTDRGNGWSSDRDRCAVCEFYNCIC